LWANKHLAELRFELLHAGDGPFFQQIAQEKVGLTLSQDAFVVRKLISALIKTVDVH